MNNRFGFVFSKDFNAEFQRFYKAHKFYRKEQFNYNHKRLIELIPKGQQLRKQRKQHEYFSNKRWSQKYIYYVLSQN